MKKVLSFVLVLSMILGSFGMAFAAPASDVVGTDYEDAVNVLTELGVVEGYKDGTYRPENIVTRAEMATFIVKALGLNDHAVGKSSFTDMAGHWADPYVAYAASLGFIAGYGDNTFRPNEPVTADQAITMLIQAIGYEAQYLNGTYPGAFVNQAATEGMLDGLKSGVEGANRGYIAQLLFNTLPVQFVRYDNEGQLDYVTMNGVAQTMLRRLGAYVANGGDPDVIRGDEDSIINLKEYLGAYASYYVDKDGDIIAIEEVKSTSLTGEVNDDGKFEVDDVEYTFGDSEYTDEDGVLQSAVTFLNGQVDTSTTEAAITNGSVTITADVSGKTIKDIYSIAKWSIDQDAKVEDGDIENMIEDAELLGEDFAKNDDQEIDMDSFELIGVDALEDIAEDNVVYVYVNADQEISRVAVGTEVIENAKVTKKNTGDNEITVNGKVYGFADLDTVVGDITVGDSYDFYLDAFGDIYYADVVSASADDYAVVVDRADGSTGLNGNDAKIKLVLEDGSNKVFVIDEDAIDDGDIESVGDIASVSAIANGTVIKYALNDDNEIKKLEIVSMTSASGDISAKGTFHGRTLASDVVILGVENMTSTGALSTDTDDYTATSRANVLDKEDVEAKYAYDSDGEIVFMLMNAEGKSDDVIYGFITKAEEIDDDSDDTVYEITILSEGEETTYKTEDFSAVVSTVSGYALNADGYIEAADADDNKAVQISVTTTAAISRVNDRVYVGSDYTYEVTLDADVVVYEYDSNKGKVVVASKSDLRGLAANTVEFWDVDEDGVADIVKF